MSTIKHSPRLGVLLLLILVTVTGSLLVLAGLSLSLPRSPVGASAGPTPLPSSPPTPQMQGSDPPLDPTAVAGQQYQSNLLNVLYNQPGLVIAQSTRTPLPGDFIQGYRVEEVQLPKPMQFVIDPKTPQVYFDQEISLLHVSGVTLEGKSIRTLDKVWRVTIFSDQTNPPGYALSWEMWQDNVHLGYGGVVLLYDRAVLREGSHLGLSYGPAPIDPVPDKLHFSETP